jgi:putative ABC transport system substrate-binding protein
MDRRGFIAGALGLLAAPLAVEAQPARKAFRIAVVSVLPLAEMTTEMTAAPGWRAFFVELQRLGYVEGQNLVVERRSVLGRPFPEIATEVVYLNPDVIVVGPNRLAAAFKVETATIPIVGASLTAPLESGLVTNLARPRGNLTGLTEDAGPEIFSKQLELLTEALPGTSRLAFVATTSLWNGSAGRLLRDAAQRLGVTLVAASMDGPFLEAQYLETFGIITRTGAQALLVGPTTEHYANRRLIAKLAVQNRLPAAASWREFVQVGGLIRTA